MLYGGAQLAYEESQALDRIMYEEEVRREALAFEQQFHYGVFYAYMRLREQVRHCCPQTLNLNPNPTCASASRRATVPTSSR